MDSLLEKEVALDALMPLIREALDQGRSVRFSPRGTSMLPLIRQGRDQVTLSPLPKTLKKYDLPLYRRENGQYVLHRIIKAGDTFTCLGDNQFTPEHSLRREQMIALVTALHRDGKEIPVTSLPYRLFCRVWHWSRPVRRIWRFGKRLLRRLLP